MGDLSTDPCLPQAILGCRSKPMAGDVVSLAAA
jgi:hypothetical protein